MAEPEKKPSLADKLNEGIKGMNLDKTPQIEEGLKSGLRKGVAFFKKAKAAVQGDEAAKEELTDKASTALVKAQEKAEQAGKALSDIADKVEQKIEQKRKPPSP